MLLLAGILGLAAVGSFVFIGDVGNEEPDQTASDDVSEENDEAGQGMIEPSTDIDGGSEVPAPPSLINGDSIQGTDGNDTLAGADGPSSIIGGAGSDAIDGADGNDTLAGGDGEDWIWAGHGDDVVSGGADNDTLHGEAGDDTLHGHEGDDEIWGHEGADLTLGGSGNDVSHGGTGADTLIGGAGNDGLLGGHDNDTLIGGPGSDSLFGGQGDDLIDGTEQAGDGSVPDDVDYLNGNDGDDTILAGTGDIVTGGAGADSIVLDSGHADDVTLIDFLRGEDQLLVVFDTVPDAADIALRPDPEDAELMLMEINGEIVASLRGAGDLTEADISMVSSQQAATWESAGAENTSPL